MNSRRWEGRAKHITTYIEIFSLVPCGFHEGWTQSFTHRTMTITCTNMYNIPCHSVSPQAQTLSLCLSYQWSCGTSYMGKRLVLHNDNVREGNCRYSLRDSSTLTSSNPAPRPILGESFRGTTNQFIYIGVNIYTCTGVFTVFT